jgi:hypothetical protein
MDKAKLLKGLLELENELSPFQYRVTTAAYDFIYDCSKRIEALEAENAALLNQMQEIVRMAAEKNRPAYDEQQRVIMELREENAALKAAMKSAMALLDSQPPRPEAAFSELLLALNPELDNRKKGQSDETGH